MVKASVRDRLGRLENRRRFLDWFVWQRFYATLSLEELETYVSGGRFPDPIPNRVSSLDTLDRKRLHKLWEEDERVFRGRSQADREYYADTGSWPERKGRLHYSMQDGKLFVEWRNETEGELQRDN
jgi:hypothetical protein